ncbi:3-oxoacyl-[acyl-carrier protein] reductase [Alkalihalobacillus xiaoxiensis]|uniref:3-oxoacyl-[acyl-carrier protein] reductase n=1 Tax=Shouchella xiaoxiensis TaxID=766895 RepID=A0ABS2T086_9BACI|nr:3-ketoacyl-ACP reductase [Shouchella xiaoxiensis]MBM7841193.1 3-oxoacyl-[acyl-carrier protein] reductase [Shouchella xiaoxiensis]
MAQVIKGKTAIVTGAGKGIGKAIALGLAKEGVNVGILARSEETLKRTVAEISALDVNVAYAAADVSSAEEVNQAIEQIKGELGSADILINNAGIGSFAPLMEMDPADWKKMIDINLMGTYYVTRAVLPQLIEKNAGDIINVASTSGLNGSPGSSAYSASKFGVIGLTESLAQEVRRNNIRVTALTPSTVATDLVKDTGLVDESKIEQYMHPEDLAEYIVGQLKLNPRMYIKNASLINTNPF